MGEPDDRREWWGRQLYLQCNRNEVQTGVWYSTSEWDSLNVIESCILLYPRQRLLPHSLVTMRRDADTATLLSAPHALVKLLQPISDEILQPLSTVPWAYSLFQVLKPGSMIWKRGIMTDISECFHGSLFGFVLETVLCKNGVVMYASSSLRHSVRYKNQIN